MLISCPGDSVKSQSTPARNHSERRDTCRENHLPCCHSDHLRVRPQVEMEDDLMGPRTADDTRLPAIGNCVWCSASD